MRILFVLGYLFLLAGSVAAVDGEKKYLAETIIVEPGVTAKDAAEIHGFASPFNLYEKSLELTQAQQKELQIIGIDVKSLKGKVPYLLLKKAHGRKNSAARKKYYIFYVNNTVGKDKYQLLVCIHRDRKIGEIYVKKNVFDGNKNPMITPAFTGQFIGRGHDQSFEIPGLDQAAPASGNLIKPIGEAVDLSADIARELRKILTIAAYI